MEWKSTKLLNSTNLEIGAVAVNLVIVMLHALCSVKKTLLAFLCTYIHFAGCDFFLLSATFTATILLHVKFLL